MLLIVEVGVWRAVEVVGVGDVVSGLFARVLVWDDVDPHGSGLGACSTMCMLCRWRRDCNRSTCLDVVCMTGGMGRGCPCV